MKKLLFIILLGGVAYGTWKYLEKVKDKTAEQQDRLKPSQKALKDIEKEEQKQQAK